MSDFTIIIRQAGTTGPESVWATYYTSDKTTGQMWIDMNFHALNTDNTCPKVKWIGRGNAVPLEVQIFRNSH